MISEVDLRDWDKVDFKEIKKQLTPYPHPFEMHIVKELRKFVRSVELIRDNQFKRVPKLLQKDQ